jgi:hypothetical protein
MHYNKCSNRCSNGCQRCNRYNNYGPVDRQFYNCNADRKVFKHQHIVKHKHDVINEYDVVHEHDYNYYDVVRNREVVKHKDHTYYRPNYCCEDRSNNCNC